MLFRSKKYGVKEYEFVNEKNEADGTHNDDEGLTFSLRTWIDVFQDIKRYARTKLTIDLKNILISYHYIRKDPKFTKEILEMVRERGGLFMTDSGIFSFSNDKSFDGNSFDWIEYLIEYTDWLKDNKEFIFSACNLDADYFVGHDEVVRWNEKFFEPLEKDINIIYVAHPNCMGRGDLDALKEYCNKYDYVAVNERMASQASAIYQMAKQTKTAIHGLAWTKPSILKDFPFIFFSIFYK